jgi:tRNA G18 (ribose-2'-O)-methylase SpoU
MRPTLVWTILQLCLKLTVNVVTTKSVNQKTTANKQGICVVANNEQQPSKQHMTTSKASQRIISSSRKQFASVL